MIHLTEVGTAATGPTSAARTSASRMSWTSTRIRRNTATWGQTAIRSRETSLACASFRDRTFRPSRWDQAEPFGVNVADENPSGLGAFEFPLRFPGQYFDKETNLHYNYFRDYDPSLGRYLETDPLGTVVPVELESSTSLRLQNLYAYVDSSPLIATDPRGLVKWYGWGRSFAFGAYGRDEYELESECKCGVQVRIKVVVDSFGFGKGASSTRDEAEFEDDFECPYPMVFAGPAVGFTGTIAFRYGVSYSRIQIGRAVSSGWSAVEGIGISAGPSVGSADVEFLGSKDCCEKK